MPSSNAPSAWRAPKVLVLANGEPQTGVIEAEVVANNHYAADCFTVVMAIGPNPGQLMSFWAAAQEVLIDLRFSLDGASFVPLIQGTVDSVVLDPVANIVRVEGRDLSAGLIETRTQETFSNRTASEIATILAQRHGLTASVMTTTTPVGRYYQDEHDRITLDQFSRATTEWDLLVFLARQEGFDIFIQGSTLYFQPAISDAASIVFLQPADLLDLRLKRSLTLARDIEVTIKSWNSRLRQGFAQSAQAVALGASGAGSAQRYVFVRPNLTPDQALKLARNKLADLIVHERVIEITMPGDLLLTPRSTISLYGTDSDFDQVYFIDVIERQIRCNEGFTQHIRAKNSSPRNQITTFGDEIGSGLAVS